MYVAIIIGITISFVFSHGFYGIEEVTFEIISKRVAKSFVGPLGFLPHTN